MFHNFGRENLCPTVGGVGYGGYLHTHNISPQLGSNKPRTKQLFPHAEARAAARPVQRANAPDLAINLAPFNDEYFPGVEDQAEPGLLRVRAAPAVAERLRARVGRRPLSPASERARAHRALLSRRRRRRTSRGAWRGTNSRSQSPPHSRHRGATTASELRDQQRQAPRRAPTPAGDDRDQQRARARARAASAKSGEPMSRATAPPTDAEIPFDAQEYDDGFADTDDAVIMPAPGVINDPRSFKCASRVVSRFSLRCLALNRARARADTCRPTGRASSLSRPASARAATARWPPASRASTEARREGLRCSLLGSAARGCGGSGGELYQGCGGGRAGGSDGGVDDPRSRRGAPPGQFDGGLRGQDPVVAGGIRGWAASVFPLNNAVSDNPPGPADSG